MLPRTIGKGLGWIFATLLLLLPLFLHQNNSSAQPVGWLSEEPLTITEKEILASTDDLPPTFGGNIPCNTRQTKTRPERPLMAQNEESNESCVVETRYGSVSKHNMLQRPGSSLHGPIQHTNGSDLLITPIPRSETALYRTGGTFHGSYMAFLPKLNTYISSKAIYDGKVFHEIDIRDRMMIQNKNGASLLLSMESINFSSNGNWMVVDSPVDGTYRINVNTGEALLFGPNFRYGVGTGVNMQTAITNDGRFAAIGSNGFTMFRIYDLATCDGVNVVTCQYVDVRKQFVEDFEDFTAINQLQFLNDHTLQTFVTTGRLSQKVTRRVLISPHGMEPDDSFQYLGLGDSFSSGEGAYDYKAFTDSDENYCHVSLVSYPFLIGHELGMSKQESIACSGALTIDITSDPNNYPDPQARNKTADSYNDEISANFLPGFRPQRFFLPRTNPQIITMSIGGNDIGFGDVLRNCLMPGTCYDTYQDRKMLLETIDQQFDVLVDTYQQVQATSPHSRIYVLGYPSLIDDSGQCDINVRLNRTEQRLANDLVNYLNRTIETATKKAGVYYVDVEDAFNGYRLCEQSWQWEIAVNGLTAGDDKRLPNTFVFNNVSGPIANESFHPNKRGHELYKTAVLRQANNLTAPMPVADYSVTHQPNHDSEPLLEGYEKPEIMDAFYYAPSLLPGNVFINKVFHIQTPLNEISLEPGSSVEAWLHSTPTLIGTSLVKSDGTVDTSIHVPDGIDPGYHTLHLRGTNSSGEAINLYDYVYVAYSETDWDGDGVLNQNEQCYFGDPAGRDIDQDGIDDACDGFIGQAPEAQASSGASTTDDTPEVGSSADNNSANRQPPLQNNPQSILLAGATADPEQTQANNNAEVLGSEHADTAAKTSPIMGEVIKSQNQPLAIVITLLISGIVGSWLLLKRI